MSWSHHLLEELQEVLGRPRIMKIRRTTQTGAERFTRPVAAVAQIVVITGALQLCREPDDDVLLETAIEGQATRVVSRDEDVTRDLELARQLKAFKIETITVSHFLKELERTHNTE